MSCYVQKFKVLAPSLFQISRSAGFIFISDRFNYLRKIKKKMFFLIFKFKYIYLYRYITKLIRLSHLRNYCKSVYNLNRILHIARHLRWKNNLILHRTVDSFCHLITRFSSKILVTSPGNLKGVTCEISRYLL